MDRVGEEKVYNTLFKLEKSLATFESEKIAKSVLTDDFIEYVSSGKIYNKRDVIEAYKNFSGINHIIIDFAIEFLSDTVVKTSFKSSFDNKKALRTSIWKFSIMIGR